MLSNNPASSANTSAHQSYSEPPSSQPDTMRATFRSRSTTPRTPARELETSTPRPDKAHERDGGSPPVIYESAARPPRAFPEDAERSQGAAGLSGIGVHDIFPSAASSRPALADDGVQQRHEFFQRFALDQPTSHDSPLLAASSARNAPELHPLTMSDQRSSAADSGRPSSRGRSYSNASRRGGPPSRQTPAQAFPSPAGHYPLLPDPSQSSYHGQYSPATSPYSQRSPYGSGQYTMSPPPPPSSMHSQQSTAPYSYATHPSLLAPDTSMHPQNQLLQAYSPGTHMPMMQTHTPVYAYSPEASSSSTQSYASSSTTTPGPFSSAPSSHTLLSNPGTSQPPYSPPTPYTARYPTQSFVYPPHTYAHSGNTLYQGQFSYAQPYRSPIPAEQDQGTWWYLPPGTRPAPSPHYHAYDNPYPSIHTLYPPIRDAEPYGSTQQAGSSTLPSPLYPMSPRHQPLEPSSAISSPSQPQLQSPPVPDPPPPPGESSSRPSSDLPRPEAPATANRTERQVHRRPYHPNPPANRSEWVMWAGNVPSDATHDELWRFFNRSPSPFPSAGSTRSRSSAGDAAPPGPTHGGVSSIHLISRSNCAFVNFESEAHLQAAIAHFNGQQLRASDPRCPRLVCRIRGRDDDLRAGVGIQRHTGIHVRYVKEQKQKQARARAMTSPETSSSEALVSSPEDPSQRLAGLSLSSDEEGPHARGFKKPAQHSSSSGSFASTNSSMLAQYFPKRYFILKSLTQFDLDLSVEKGLWATQRHNEGVLDQAYRTSKEVYLIFGVNKSGEFYGYAKMAGPVLHHHHGENRVSWASRSSADSSSRRASISTKESSSPRASRAPQYFSPGDGNRLEESPLPMESPEAPVRPGLQPESQTAPAVLHGPHRPLSTLSVGIPRHGEHSYQEIPTAAPAAPAIISHGRRDQEHFKLDPQAPLRAAKQRSADAVLDDDGVKHWDAVGSLSAVKEEEESPRSPPSRPAPTDPKGKAPEDPAEGGADKDEGPVWGDSFQVEWIRTARLPFYRTRHLRNPWNHDREIKVSRDGTELEPSVGQALLDEWDKPEPAQPPPQRSGTKSVPPGAATSPISPS